MELQGYMRKAAVAEYLGVTVQTVSKLMRQKKLPFHKLSHKLVLFRLRDIDAAMDKFERREAGE